MDPTTHPQRYSALDIRSGFSKRSMVPGSYCHGSSSYYQAGLFRSPSCNVQQLQNATLLDRLVLFQPKTPQRIRLHQTSLRLGSHSIGIRYTFHHCIGSLPWRHPCLLHTYQFQNLYPLFKSTFTILIKSVAETHLNPLVYLSLHLVI